MFSLCPKCESGSFDSSGSCNFCGYTLRTLCNNCFTANIPAARFCGGCGRGMTFAARVSKLINSHIDYILQLRLRRFVAGASFGTLLALFTLGSMGMRSSTDIGTSSVVRVQTAKHYASASKFTQPIKQEISQWLSLYEKNQLAELSHLVRITDIILKHLAPVATFINGNKPMAASANEYLKLLNNFSKSGKLTRGSAAIIVFNFLSDFIGFTYKDFQDKGQFSDIPKYHFLSIPATALNQLGIFSEYRNREFRPTKAMTLAELNEIAKSIITVAEIHIKAKVFSSLPPTL